MPTQPTTATPDVTRKLKSAELRELVSEGASLALSLEGMSAIAARLDVIKEQLRAHVGKIAVETKLEGNDGAVAVLKPVKDTLVRSTSEELQPRIMTIAGGALHKLFAFAPRKDFALNAFKALSKASAEKLLKLLEVASSHRVSFSGGKVE